MNTSRGWVFDLVNSIANDLAIVNHLTEAMYARQKDYEDSGDEKYLELRNRYKELALYTLRLRRDKMALLKDTAEEYDDKMWCALKHSIESYMEAMEVWQAEQTPETETLMNDSMSVLAGALSLFLGYDLEMCARCLADSLKADNSLKAEHSAVEEAEI